MMGSKPKSRACATVVGNSWIAKSLSMGHSGSVSRMIGTCRKSGELTSTFKPLSKAPDEA
jgi:hypothetical protein